MNVGTRLGLLRPAQFEVVGEDGHLTITRTSITSGRRNTMTLPVTRAQLARHGCGGSTIQDVFPELTADQREFILSGMTPEEWNNAFPPEDEDE